MLFFKAHQEKRTMTRLRTSLLTLALVTSAPLAALAQVDVTGDWTITVESPQGAMSIDAAMKQAGEDLTGTITSPMGSVDFKGKMIKDALNVVYTFDMQGNAIQITMTGTVAGDSIAGNLSLGGLGDVPWSAKRKAAVAGTNGSTAAGLAAGAGAGAASAGGSTTDVSGKWDITFNMAGNPMPATATFMQTGEKVTGTIASQAGETAVAGVMAGSALTLDFKVETPQGEITITMTGDLGASGIAGKATIVGLGDAEWTATRAR
jgi:hypothetical protein